MLQDGLTENIHKVLIDLCFSLSVCLSPCICVCVCVKMEIIENFIWSKAVEEILIFFIEFSTNNPLSELLNTGLIFRDLIVQPHLLTSSFAY